MLLNGSSSLIVAGVPQRLPGVPRWLPLPPSNPKVSPDLTVKPLGDLLCTML
ncbi:hypothetical protein GLOTRDRAFT_107256 [Gloeophyllum trabeum ATCC 11539]|uniref:Uncharacterized protein n=1 Tax=Gloeophyllum trabeum (strain ATCC 11539 / FP-39264 / Madison 617) TaxID=670483 RepID=S7RG25_GLOTA|nr:uncharacterized protein GLOTRDRAFT_107256 [Gloeophyllum trabeum ATCC 11539]EPQ53175.1 hypothetical protein GLOTRDRAFT_107256 [Gloeophyllum trabeum ATCC 11539]